VAASHPSLRPEGVDADKIEASFKNGVLTLTLAASPIRFLSFRD
jgi:hypothetical protein